MTDEKIKPENLFPDPTPDQYDKKGRLKYVVHSPQLYGRTTRLMTEIVAEALKYVKGAEIEITTADSMALAAENEELRAWMEANVPEMECRMDEDCDHCEGVRVLSITRPEHVENLKKGFETQAERSLKRLKAKHFREAAETRPCDGCASWTSNKCDSEKHMVDCLREKLRARAAAIEAEGRGE